MSGSLNQKLFNPEVINRGSIKQLSNRIKILEERNPFNYIINGDLRVWQENTTFTIASGTGNTYTADRFCYERNIDAGVVITQETEISGEFLYSLKITPSATTTAVNKYAFVRYTIEGFDYLPLVGKPVNLKFEVKSNKTGTYCIALRNKYFGNSNDRSFIAEITINSVDLWEEKSITIPLDYSGGTWYFDNQIGVEVDIILNCTYPLLQTTFLETWENANYIATQNQANLFDTAGTYFQIKGIQLTQSDTELPFLHRLKEEELSLCQRYYEKSYDINVYPDTITSKGLEFYWQTVNSNYAANGTIRFETRKRAEPITTFYGCYGTVPSGPNTISVNGVATSVLSTVWGRGETSVGIPRLTTGSLTAGDEIRYHWTAEAEL